MLDHLGQTKRTHNCGELRTAHAGQTVTLMGWVNSYRDQGQLLFIHLRDREGITQIVCNESVNAELLAKAKQVRREFVIAVTGTCINRDEANFNPVMATGEVEVAATEIKFLNDAQTPPFELENCVASEELRLKYRYLDLRRVEMQKNFRLRHKLTLAVRDYLDSRGFFEIETPILTKSTPEGARDYLVPARTAPGKFYALPQSPQLFKQLLMIGGYDKYFQIARCFRDEDLRADRQPEFTQIDMEMSFVQPDDVFEIVEGMVCAVFKAAGHDEPARPFQRMPYNDAMNKYGSDKPDLRFGLEMQDLSEQFASSAFPVFADAVAKGGAVKALVVKGAATWSRKQYDEIGEHAKRHGAGGLAYIQILESESKSALTKFLGADGIAAINQAVGAIRRRCRADDRRRMGNRMQRDGTSPSGNRPPRKSHERSRKQIALGRRLSRCSSITPTTSAITPSTIRSRRRLTKISTTWKAIWAKCARRRMTWFSMAANLAAAPSEFTAPTCRRKSSRL